MRYRDFHGRVCLYDTYRSRYPFNAQARNTKMLDCMSSFHC